MANQHDQHDRPAAVGAGVVGRGLPVDEPHTHTEPDGAAIAAALEQARRGIASEPARPAPAGQLRISQLRNEP